MHVNNLVPILAGVAGISMIPSVQAWGAAGHEIIATIAQIHLHPTVLPKLCSILNFTSINPNEPQCHLAPIAAWADRVRYLPQYRWTAPLHYVEGRDDYPSETCAFPGEHGWVNRPGKNLLAAIHNMTGILQDWDGEEVEVGSPTNEALKFLVHFYGDLHMPLHLAGRARGGNGIKVLFDGRHTNLHSLWDGLLIAQRIRTLPRNYTVPLPFPKIEYNLRGTIYDPYVRRLMWEGIMGRWKDDIQTWISCPASDSTSSDGIWQKVMSLFKTDIAAETDDDTICPYAWAKPTNALNCDFIFPKAIDEPPYNQQHLSLESDSYLSPESEVDLVDSKGHYRAGSKGSGSGPYLELDTPEYAGKIRNEFIVEKLLAQGGIRLAGVLNLLFADLEENEVQGELWTQGF